MYVRGRRGCVRAYLQLHGATMRVRRNMSAPDIPGGGGGG